MLPMVSKELGKACFNDIMSWTKEVEQGGVVLGNCTLRADLIGIMALRRQQLTRAGWDHIVRAFEGHLHSVPLM